MSNDEINPVNESVTETVNATEVLRRAIELDHLPGNSLEDVPLDHQALSEIAADIGVSPSSLAAALADGQAGVLSKRTIVDRIVGPRWVWSSRTVPADDQVARDRLVEWLSVAHGLRPRVRPDGVVVARKRRDLAGKLGSGVRRVQGLGELGKVKQIKAAAVTIEAEIDDGPSSSPSSLCLAADVSSQRNDAIAGGSAAAVGVSAVIGVAAFASGPVLLISLPVAAGVGTIVARRAHRTTIVRMTESVDHTVDGVALGDNPPKPLDGLTRKLKPSN